MASKYCSGKEEEWEVASMRRFHGLKWGLPQGSISYAQDRPTGRCHCRPSSDEFLGCLPILSSDTFGLGWSGEDCFCYPYRELPLQSNAIRFEECRIHISENDDKDVWVAIGEKPRNVHRWYGCEKVSEHLGDLRAIFEILRKYKLRLNASKCSFGVGSGKFLGYMVTYRGIGVNHDQIKTINNLRSLQNPKEV